VDELPLDVWQRTIDVNLTGVFLTCKHGIRALLAVGGGSVICTASPTSLFGFAVGFDAYTASKAGVLGLMRVMAAEYAEQSIRVNAVIPGFINTPLVRDIMADPRQRDGLLAQIPAGRPGRPEEVASLWVYVASDDASYVTGAALAVDGGQTAI
jgi:3-oxoacyl-[acyl-carrier protein] reductase